jgi:hypothetical protein
LVTVLLRGAGVIEEADEKMTIDFNEGSRQMYVGAYCTRGLAIIDPLA